jgi:hypothetical protein
MDLKQAMNPNQVVEIEQKYDVEDTTPIPPLQDLPGVSQVDQPVDHQLEAN